MTKKQATYIVLENEYLSDGVYSESEVASGTKLQCERYLYGYNHHNPMRIVLESDYYTEEELAYMGSLEQALDHGWEEEWYERNPEARPDDWAKEN